MARFTPSYAFSCSLRWLNTRSPRWRIFLVFLIFLAGWQTVGQLELIPGGVFPSLTAIAQQFWQDAHYYPPHLGATLRNALIGYLCGNVLAVALALLFVISPISERLLGGFLLSVFSIPLIILVPIVGSVFGGDMPAIILASLAVYYPTLTTMLVGLRKVDPAYIDIVRALGGNSLMSLRKVRIRSSLPSLTAGLRIAAPAAILGTMLGELAGAPKGLGIFLETTIRLGEHAREWGICFVASGTAAIIYAAIGFVGASLTDTSTASTLSTGNAASSENKTTPIERRVRVRLFSWFTSVLTTLLIWEICTRLINNRYVFKGPLEIYRFLVNLSAEDKTVLLDALRETLDIALFGLLVGLGAALILATLLHVRREWAIAIVPFALVSQTVPLVAFVALIVLILGRDFKAMLLITMSVTFFPAFVTIFQGLQQVPNSLVDVVRVHKDSSLTILFKIRFPSALPFVFAAARLVAPRVLMGVILAEYLITNTGIGALLMASRGKLDFKMIWTIAIVTASVSLCLYQLVYLIEFRLLRRYGFIAKE